MSIKIEEIRGAVARGWCHPQNSAKVMDSDLAEAISQELQKLLVSDTGPSADVSVTTALGSNSQIIL